MRERSPWWLVALTGIAIVLPSRISVPVAVMIVAVATGSRWRITHVSQRVELSCSAPRWADHGQRIEAVLELRNPSRMSLPVAEVELPCALGLGRNEPYREALRVAPRSLVRRHVPLWGGQRGCRPLGPPRLEAGDALGFTGSRTVTGEALAVTVFPRIVPLERLGLPAQSPFVRIPNQRSLLVDPSAVIGVRQYQAGDPFSAIHWTATARIGSLMVKQREQAEARDTVVCLDLASRGYPRRGRNDAVELAITVAASVLHHSILGLHLPAGLLAANGPDDPGTLSLRFPPRAEHGHLRRMLEFLAVANHGAHLPLPVLLASLGHLPTGTTVLAVSGTLTAETAGHLLRLAREGVPVAVAVTGPDATEDVLTVGSLWLPVYRVTDEVGFARLAS